MVVPSNQTKCPNKRGWFWVFDKRDFILLERRDSQIEYFGARQPIPEDMGMKVYILFIYIFLV